MTPLRSVLGLLWLAGVIEPLRKEIAEFGKHKEIGRAHV